MCIPCFCDGLRLLYVKTPASTFSKSIYSQQNEPPVPGAESRRPMALAGDSLQRSFKFILLIAAIAYLVQIKILCNIVSCPPGDFIWRKDIICNKPPALKISPRGSVLPHLLPEAWKVYFWRQTASVLHRTGREGGAPRSSTGRSAG